MSFFTELKQRNVFRVGIVYLVVAWLILQVSDTLVPALRLPEWFHSGVAFVLIVGFPVALLLAWAFELTPEGLKKEKDVDRSQSGKYGTGRKLDFVIIVLLAVTAGYFAYDKFVLGSGGDTASHGSAARKPPKSIAVLPFVAMSSGEDDNYFADGLTEEILNALTQLPDLKVTARTSSFFFKGQNIPIPEIAARLDVAHVVEGSVRRDGEQVRITAQLVRAADGFHLWSHSYDRTLEDVFAVQEDIAENIATVLDVVLDEKTLRMMRGVGIRNVEAFIDFQKGMEAFAAAHTQIENIADALASANLYFDRALDAAPDMVVARVLKADLAGHIVFEYGIGLRKEQSAGEAQAALVAVRDESDLAWRLSPPGNQRDILDLERILFHQDWTEAPDRIEKALQPGECPQLNWTSEFITPFGWAAQLTAKYREALACDPVSFVANAFLPFSLIWLGDPEAALEQIDTAKNRGLAHPWLNDGQFLALLSAGRVDDPRLRGQVSESSAMMFDRQIMYEALAGDPERARHLADQHWSKPGVDDWSSMVVAAIVGDRDKANKHAARIDAIPGGALALNSSVYACYCGAPFDLEATPNYRARIEEAGFSWPPRKPIEFPAKTW